MLDAHNVFDTEEKWERAQIEEYTPQAFGYAIADDAELARVVTDAATLETIRHTVAAGGKYPTIYLLNHQGCAALAAHLGGHIPRQREQQAIWRNIPGSAAPEKARHAGMPFAGYFDAADRRFHGTGTLARLASSSFANAYCLRCFQPARSGDARRMSGPCGPMHGFQCMVVFG